MVERREIFVDSSAFAALAIWRDGNHHVANAAGAELAHQRRRLITSNLVVAETHALVLARAGRDTAWRTLQRIEQGVEQTVRISEEDERRARWIIERYRDKDFSLTDATSFAVMERLAIDQAFTFDRHFA